MSLTAVALALDHDGLDAVRQADHSTTLSDFLGRIEQRHGRANRIWVMDRGIPTEDSVAQMRAKGACYLVGTPKERLSKLERALVDQPWACSREGVQVKRLGTDLDAQQPGRLWSFYIQLTEVEQAFKELEHDLAVRPILVRTEDRMEAHIFVAFLACCLQVTSKAKLRAVAAGLTPAEVIAEFKTMQMVDLHVPTTDGRELLLSRCTQPEAEHRMLLQHLRLSLPEQPPPRISAHEAHRKHLAPTAVQ